MNDETDPFGLCESLAEVFVVMFHLEGLPGVAHVLGKLDATRESLRDAAGMFQRIGMREIADMLRLTARKARRARPIFGVGYQTESARIIIARKRADLAKLAH
jgi:hypothetical protein